MSSCQLVNVWSDAELGPAAFLPMQSSLLWLPEGANPTQALPAFVFIHDWGAYPYSPVATDLCPRLADEGFAVLSLCLRRRGVEGQLSGVPDDDLRDIKLALDYLRMRGARAVFLLGDGMGGRSALRYLARSRDVRVKGLCWRNPLAAPASELQEAIGATGYAETVAAAGTAMRQGAGAEMRVELSPVGLPPIVQYANAFLAWWGPDSVTAFQRDMEDCAAPALLLRGARAVPEIYGSWPGRDFPVVAGEKAGEVAAEVAGWARECGADTVKVAAPEPVTLDGPGQPLFGLLWSPADGASPRTAVLLVHGLTSTPTSPLFLKMAPVLAQSGVAALSVELRRSGWAGHETSVLENDREDIGAWVECLVARGYQRVVLAGASIGSISVGRYLSVDQPDSVAAIAHLMPTAECPDWFRAAAGAGAYDEAVVQATSAIAAGRGEHELIDIDVRQPPPNTYGGRFRWTQRADSWLSWWGPDADSRNSKHMPLARVPVLLLSGTEDSYNDQARFAELKEAASNAPSVAEKWYPGVDHGLGGVEEQVARDICSWLAELELL